MTMDRRLNTVTVMQMLHTHDAVQAGEGVNDKQLVCGHFQYNTTLSTRGCTHSYIDKKRGKTSRETVAQTHTLLINTICNTTKLY